MAFICLIISNTLTAQNNLQSIVRAVQKTSQQSYDAIHTVSFKGYSKTYAYFGYSPLEVDLIPFVEEYYFDGFWMKPDSLRMIVRALRSIEYDADSVRNTITDGMPLPNPFHFIYDPSALGIDSDRNDHEDEGNDDEIKVGDTEKGFASEIEQEKDGDEADFVMWPLYPFAEGADSLYDYRLESEIGFGENRILIVHVNPKDPDMPAVIGSFMIDAYRYEVVGSDIVFNEAADIFVQARKREGWTFKLMVTGTNQHRVETEKALLYGSYWLPLTMEEDFDIALWGMNVIVHRSIQFDSYIVNPEQPDLALLSETNIVYNRDPGLEREIFGDSPYPNRLTQEEEKRLVARFKNQLISSDLFMEFLESENLAEEAAKMSMKRQFGRHLRFVQGLGDYFVYNRVESLRLQYTFRTAHWPWKQASLSLTGGYGIGDKRWKGEAAAMTYLSEKQRFFLEGAAFKTVGFQEDRLLITTGNNTFTTLLYKGDYRDYYYQTGFSLGMGCRLTDQLVAKIGFVSQKEENASIKTQFSIFRNGKPFRSNPEIIEGTLRSIKASVLYRTTFIDADFYFEYSNPDILGSDFFFRLVKGNLRHHWRLTYYSDLRFHVAGAFSWGTLPPQQWFDFGGRMFLNYHGNLRGVDYKAFTGDRGAYATLEYGVKGSVFKNLVKGFDWIQAFKLTLWAGAGWSDLSDSGRGFVHGLDTPMLTAESGYREIGIGIGDVLNVFRVDFIWNNISEKEVLIRFNMLQ